MSIVQLFNREQRAYADFSAVNTENKRAWEQAIFAYAWYYPVVELLSSVAIALVIWRGGYGILHKVVDMGILIAFIPVSYTHLQRVAPSASTASRCEFGTASIMSRVMEEMIGRIMIANIMLAVSIPTPKLKPSKNPVHPRYW